MWLIQHFILAESSLLIQNTAKQLCFNFPTCYSVRANLDTLPKHVNLEASLTTLLNSSQELVLGWVRFHCLPRVLEYHVSIQSLFLLPGVQLNVIFTIYMANCCRFDIQFLFSQLWQHKTPSSSKQCIYILRRKCFYHWYSNFEISLVPILLHVSQRTTALECVSEIRLAMKAELWWKKDPDTGLLREVMERNSLYVYPTSSKEQGPLWDADRS
jgi:hypothetical protein